MNTKDIFDHILLRSGQFVMSKTKVELDEDRFSLLVEEALAIYSKYSPFEKHFYVEVTNNRTYRFTEGNTFGAGEPDAISSVTPIRVLGINPWMLRQVYGIPMSDGNIDIRQECPWEYRKPYITFPYPGEFDILAFYRHKIIKLEDDDGRIYYDIPAISLRDDAFMKLIRGMFLEGIGRSRRSFTLNDLPIVMDADTIANEGREMITEATEQMQKEAKFYLAFGG